MQKSLLGYIWKPLLEDHLTNEFKDSLEFIKSRVLNDEVNHDAHLFKDAGKIFKRIKSAIQNSERIMLVGDYDVDGISGVSILFLTLQKLGANVSYRIPHRERDGYGLKSHQVEECKNLEVSLIITVDNGISANEACKLAKDYCIDVIITDHHSFDENSLPEVFAYMHPGLSDSGYPYKFLSGAGVALKLAQILISGDIDFIDSLYQLATLGTICDIVPLNGENRFIVKKGLLGIKKTPIQGIKELLLVSDILGKDITSFDIGFKIGPRINAAGRMDHGIHALHVLTNHMNAKDKAVLINDLNIKRQDIMKEAIDEAMKQVSNMQKNKILFVKNSSWNPGIIGLIASKLKDHFSKPVFVFGQFENSNIWTCSGRSIKGFDITNFLKKGKEYLIHFGGHEMACGCSLSDVNIEKFINYMLELSNDFEISDEKIFNFDFDISPLDITLDNFRLIKDFEPFGEGNPVPRFEIKNIFPKSIFRMGSDDAHLKIVLENDIECVAFSFGKFFEEINNSKTFSLLGSIDINYWNDKERVQFKVNDIRIDKK